LYRPPSPNNLINHGAHLLKVVRTYGEGKTYLMASLSGFYVGGAAGEIGGAGLRAGVALGSRSLPR
jgi:hypothetical protein